MKLRRTKNGLNFKLKNQQCQKKDYEDQTGDQPGNFRYQLIQFIRLYNFYLFNRDSTMDNNRVCFAFVEEPDKLSYPAVYY